VKSVDTAVSAETKNIFDTKDIKRKIDGEGKNKTRKQKPNYRGIVMSEHDGFRSSWGEIAPCGLSPFLHTLWRCEMKKQEKEYLSGSREVRYIEQVQFLQAWVAGLAALALILLLALVLAYRALNTYRAAAQDNGDLPRMVVEAMERK